MIHTNVETLWLEKKDIPTQLYHFKSPLLRFTFADSILPACLIGCDFLSNSAWLVFPNLHNEKLVLNIEKLVYKLTN